MSGRPAGELAAAAGGCGRTDCPRARAGGGAMGLYAVRASGASLAGASAATGRGRGAGPAEAKEVTLQSLRDVHTNNEKVLMSSL